MCVDMCTDKMYTYIEIYRKRVKLYSGLSSWMSTSLQTPGTQIFLGLYTLELSEFHSDAMVIS